MGSRSFDSWAALPNIFIVEKRLGFTKFLHLFIYIIIKQMRRLIYVIMGMLLLQGQLFAQNRTVSGIVSDNNGQPLPSVSVRVPATNIGTITGPNGAFTLSVPQNTQSLEFSYVGFATQTVTIPASGTVTVSLAPGDNTVLNTVVVTGYTNVKKSQYAGSASKVTKEQINYVPSASFDQILQGKAPGLLVTVGSGQPGSSARVQIRGASSINGGNGPLYVVDGMPVEPGVFQSINPNDFESVDVLRDAIATSQYGNRGSNGVIVATTKKGRIGKMVISYNGQYGITEAGKEQFDMMNSSELLQFHEILGQQQNNGLPGWVYSRNNPANAGLPASTLTQYDKILDSLRNINTNWSDIFQRQGKFQSHDINFSGGSGGTRYFLSAGYYTEDGIGLRSDLDRYTLRANLDSKTDKITFSFNGTAGYTHRNFIESENSITLANPFAAAYLGLPYHQLYNPATGYYDTGGGKTGANAYARVFETSSLNDQLKLLSSANLNYDITRNISLGGFAGIDYRSTTNEASTYPGTYAANNDGFPIGPENPPGQGGGSFGNATNSFLQYIVRVNAGYHKLFAEKHDVDFSVFSEYTREKQKAFSYTGFGIDPKLLNTPAAITPGTVDNKLIPIVGGSKTGRALYGANAALRYTYDSRYTFYGSFRRDGSSQLPEANRWQNFYSLGLTWNTLRESFAQNWNFLSDLRVRASYGTSANADGFVFGNFGYLALYGPGVYAGSQTTVPINAGNPDLKWERIGTLNLGFDFGFFKNRLNGTLDLYNKKGTDNIVSQKLPLETGFRSQDINAATVRNRGVELALNVDVVKTRDLTWP